MRLLLVDDDRGLLELMRHTFDEVEAEIIGAESTKDARLAIEQERPDVIVLDVLLPGESGLDLCRELKGRPETAGIPIVLLSGSIEVVSRQAADTGAENRLQRAMSFHRPMQYRFWSPRRKICPWLMAGDAKVFSPSSLRPTRVNSVPGRTTFITPSSFRK